MQHGTNELYASDRKEKRKICCFLVAALFVVFAASLCVGVDAIEIYPPTEVLHCYGLAIEQMIPGSLPLSNTDLLAREPHYYQVLTRLSINLATCICGALLAVSGSVYQLAFRNPVAAPTMLGVSNGVRLGLMIAVLQFDVLAGQFVSRAYAYAAISALLTLGLVFVLAYLITPKERRASVSVVDMLLLGTIVSSMIGAAVTYVQDYVMTEDQYNLFWNLSETMSADQSTLTWILLLAACAVALFPLFVCRFGINALSLSDDDAKMLGIKTGSLRLVTIVLSTFMMIVAQLVVGTISMVCLVVPHVSRMLFGADFRRQIAANVFIGALLLVICRFACSLIPFAGQTLPLGPAVSVVVLPAFVWLVALQQRRWAVE